MCIGRTFHMHTKVDGRNIMLKIATWNVNSLRVRLAHLLQWADTQKPDVIALQETKLEDKDFPLAEIEKAGYQAVYSGQKTYNGVALLTRDAVQEVNSIIPQLDDPQRRILAATYNDVRIINLYVPNGSSVGSEKYSYKLAWLTAVTHYLKQQLQQYPHLVVLGDFNIAPEDRDVHDPKAWEGNVLVSEPERTALQKIVALGLQDAFRLFEQAPGFYSWWDYRVGAWRRNNGLRIDHILISEALRERCASCLIDKIPRSWERPSDHTPVVADFRY